MNPEIIEKQKNAMAEEGLEAFISISPENFAYTTGMVVPSQPVMRWRHAIAIALPSGEVTIVVVDMEETTVKGSGKIQDVRIYREFVDDPMDKLSQVLIDLKLDRSKVGIEMEYLPAKDLLHLQHCLPHLELVPIDHILNRLREVKTPAELELLRTLSRLTDKAIHQALSQVRAGATEMELAGYLTRSIFEGGAENFKLMIVASGERSQYPNVGPSQRVIEEGDLIRMEIFGVQNGYHAGVCRTAVVGNPTHEQERIWQNLMECKHLVMDLIKPGASCQNIYRCFLNKFTDLGFKPISFVGHGIGLFLHEEPYLGPHGNRTLERGMVLAVEPLVFIPGRMGLQNKDMLAVAQSGCELLSNCSSTDELLRVG